MKMPALREKAALASFPICTLSGSTALITRCTHAYFVAGKNREPGQEKYKAEEKPRESARVKR